MTRSPGTTRRRRGVAALVAAGCLGLAGWSIGADGAGGPAPSAEPEVTTTTAGPATTAPATTTTTAPPALPVPEPPPADPYAPTPEVVHGTLALPTLGVSQPLYEGVTLTAINRGPSHWPGTAMPGEVGNVVVAGHRTTFTRPFHDLDRLQPGDPLVFTMDDGTTWTYELIGLSIVDPDALEILTQTNERTATLFACHPKGSAAQRIVAHFRLADPAPG
ncbi:MAG TPA: class E sortase [Acidimicrobiales bacterium]|nr:class E sortase [Acidimicrobiales bacterium]